MATKKKAKPAKKSAKKKTKKKQAAAKKSKTKKKQKPAPKKKKKKTATAAAVSQASLTNAAMQKHPFLRDIKNDSYYPPGAAARGIDILVRLCAAFERERPATADAVYALTHAATEEFNAMLDDDIDLETVAREAIAGDIAAILAAYGHDKIDIEEAIAPRDW